jgi:uncharacterized protein (TIGR02145 family)
MPMMQDIFLADYIIGNDATGKVSGSGLGGGPQGACPPGWTVPTNEDWEDLAKALKGSAVGFS